MQSLNSKYAYVTKLLNSNITSPVREDSVFALNISMHHNPFNPECCLLFRDRTELVYRRSSKDPQID